MSKKTLIQWCDSTVNPVMGCGGCELYPMPAAILGEIDRVLIESGALGWKDGRARQAFEQLLGEAWRRLQDSGKSGIGHIDELTTTNLYHLRKQFEAAVKAAHGKAVAQLAVNAIERQLTCYAAKLHLHRGYSISKPSRKPHKGYAPTFEQITTFPGRLRQAANMTDLNGQHREGKPWLGTLPRLIFLSDMGDALTNAAEFDFLRSEISETQSKAGRNHLWLWLTKRPELMKRFAASVNGLPSNICAMTTVTSASTLHRIDALREVEAAVRGLSIEPLWSPIADNLDLTGIDWVIVGGESGAANAVQPFCVEWAEDLRDRCREQGVAFFLKQLGSCPTRDQIQISLTDKHGGDWEEWEQSLRIREMPRYFSGYRPSGLVRTRA